MPVEYVRVKPLVDLFSPAIRPTGAVAIIGAATAGTDDEPVLVASPSDAATQFGEAVDATTEPPTLRSALTRAIQTAFRQSPGPTQVWGVKSGSNLATALTEVEKLEVQFVVLADTRATDQTVAPSGAIGQLSAHVTAVSNAGDGKERMGVAMLEPAALTRPAGTPENERMVYVAHNSDDDVAAAVAGTIAGYDPHVSMVLKPVAVASAPFTSTQIETINGAETFESGPAGKGLNWLTKPALLPGGGVYLGEGYTGSASGKKYIDIVRTVDDISFKLKARLIRTIGTQRISRAGLRGLSVQLEAILPREVAEGVIEGYDIVIPLLPLLDADPRSLSEAQLAEINNAQNDRVAQVLVAVDYAGAIHRISLQLRFD